MATLTTMPPEKYFDEALKACRKELESLGPARKFLKIIGDSGDLERRILESFSRKFNYTLLRTGDTFRDLFIYLDKRAEAVERVLMRYGLELSLMFNLKFFEDVSHLYPIEPDNLDEELKDRWDWDTIHHQVLELFYEKMQVTIYEMIGFNSCGTELMIWIRDFVSEDENRSWWDKEIKSLVYTTVP